MNSKETKLQGILKRGELTFYASLICIILLPSYNPWIPPFMILWILFWISENLPDFKKLFDVPMSAKLLLCAFISYYLFELVGLIYSEDLKMGLSNSFGRLSLVLFPLVMFAPGEWIKNKITLLLRVFALSSAAYLILVFLFAAYRSWSFINGVWVFNPHPPEFDYLSYFYGNDLTVFQHPSYFAMYAVLSAFISFESFFDKSCRIQIRILWLLLGSLFLVSLFFISSRSGLLAGLILVPFYFSLKLKNAKRRILIFGGIIFILAISLPLLLKNQRVQYLYDKISQKETVGENVREPRLIIWESAAIIIRENFLLGVGIGDVRNKLAEQYVRVGAVDMAQLRLNAHNQFLEVFIENGFIGLLLFLSIFGVMIHIAFTDKNLLLGVFIVMIFVFFMFETVLYRLGGVSFFSLFSLLLIHFKSHRKPQL